jgi:hypothetical protein
MDKKKMLAVRPRAFGRADDWVELMIGAVQNAEMRVRAEAI